MTKTTVDVAAIRAALAKATPGEWDKYGRGDNQISNSGDAFGHVGSTTFGADAELIVLLRNNAEALLDDYSAKSDRVERIIAAEVVEAERRGAVKALRSAANKGRYSGTLFARQSSWLDERADAIENGGAL